MRKRRVICIIAVFVITIIFVFANEIMAGKHGGCSYCSQHTGNIKHVIRIVPRPPGWPQMWIAADVIKSLNENGLIVEKTRKEKGPEISDLPSKTKEAIKFSVTVKAKTFKGCVLEFNERDNFEKIKKHYLDLNNNGRLHTWSLIKDNILLVIDGSMSDQEIRRYETVLAGMK